MMRIMEFGGKCDPTQHCFAHIQGFRFGPETACLINYVWRDAFIRKTEMLRVPRNSRVVLFL